MNQAPIDELIFKDLKEMVGEDFIGELIDTFLEDAPKLIQDLQHSLAKRDIETFRRSAHSLKSNSATFGAKNLSEQAKELEMLAREQRLDAVGEKITVLQKEYAGVEEGLKRLRHEFC